MVTGRCSLFARFRTAVYLVIPTPLQPYGSFSGTTHVSQCQKKASSDFMVQSTSISPPTHFHAGCPSSRTLPIYPGLGQAQEYAGLHNPTV